MSYIQGNTGKWEYVIGLEVHAQVSSEAKLFSPSATEYGASPNTQVSLIDAAMPGMLPVLNEYCVKQAIKTGLGIDAKINKKSVFDIAADLVTLQAAASSGTLSEQQLTGGTFTITNLGMYEIDAFTPIINLPQCAILGIGRIVATCR